MQSIKGIHTSVCMCIRRILNSRKKNTDMKVPKKQIYFEQKRKKKEKREEPTKSNTPRCRRFRLCTTNCKANNCCIQTVRDFTVRNLMIAFKAHQSKIASGKAET